MNVILVGEQTSAKICVGTRDARLWSAAADGGAFDPETSITWHSLFYAGGSSMSGYSDTDPVSTWYNETAEGDATPPGTAPVFVASDSNLNGQPSVDTSGGGVEVGSFTAAPDYTSGVSFVIVFHQGTSTAGQTLIDGSTGSGSVRNLVRARSSSTQHMLYAGSVRAATPDADNGSHGLVAFFDGSTGNDTLTISGVQVADINAGSGQLAGIAIGGDEANSNRHQSTIAFVGVYEGDISGDGQWSAMQTWASDTYGVTL